jgi:hypothetical protein
MSIDSPTGKIIRSLTPSEAVVPTVRAAIPFQYRVKFKYSRSIKFWMLLRFCFEWTGT